MSHGDDVVKSDDNRRHDREERVVTLPQTFGEAAPVLAGHIVALYGTNDAVTNFVSRMSKSKIAVDEGITNEETFVKELSELIKKDTDQLWSKEHVAASITTKYRNDGNGGHNVELEGLVKELLKLRRVSGMTRHADYIHLDLIYRFGESFEPSLHKAWLEAGVKPELLVEMIWVDDGAILLKNRPTALRPDWPFFWYFGPVRRYACVYQKSFPYSEEAISMLDLDRLNKHRILVSQLKSKDIRTV